MGINGSEGQYKFERQCFKMSATWFRSSPPECAMSAICTGLYGIKGKDSLAGVPHSRRQLSLALCSVLLGSMQAQPFQPCWLLEWKGLLTRQRGRAVLPTWHHFDHLPKQTNKQKQSKAKQSSRDARGLLLPLKGFLRSLSHLRQPPWTLHPEGHTWVEELFSPKTKPALKADLQWLSGIC